MKPFIITYVTENGSRVKERIDARCMSDAVRIFLHRTPSELNLAITFNITKMQVN